VVTKLPTSAGEFDIVGYTGRRDGQEYVALVKGPLTDFAEPVLLRIHSECLTGDVFGSQRCDCGPQLHAAMSLIQQRGRGVVVYLRQEGRGIGLINKLRAYQLQDGGQDTVEANESLGFGADLRDYEVAVCMLNDLGIRRVELLTNNPRKTAALRRYGITVTQRVPLHLPPTSFNRRYLETKRDKMGHELSLD
jgi:3,4-dihydroxy 2-butanone 4-phosphate synthase/GTP cyclohydrolase II